MVKTTNYFGNNSLAETVFRSKYAVKKHGEVIEQSPEDMHKRLAGEFARIEKKYGGSDQISEDKIFALLDGFEKIIPQGSVMASLGNPYQIASLSNCVVLPELHDSYGGICYADQQLVQLMKRRCGVGIDISTLRPHGSLVSNAAQTSTGAVSFMHRFSNSTREVAQDGRRGALMITMDIRHPEADEFITVKEDLTKVTGANISLKLTDNFMQAAICNDGYNHYFRQQFPIENPITIWQTDAKGLWNKIVAAAHKSAEPGLIFWDRQHRYSPSSLYPAFRNISTNPCSEIAMGNDTCRLISLNIFSCVGLPFTPSATFDFEEWYWMNYQGMRLMDDLVDLEIEAIQRIIKKIISDKEPDYIKEPERRIWTNLIHAAREGRRTGLGFTALADAVAALGIQYGSDEFFTFVEQLMKVKLAAELDSMMDMAEQRGAFPAFDAELEAKYAEENDTFFHFIKNTFPDKWVRMQKVGRRNISWSTVAPNGTLSLLAALRRYKNHGSTSGMEPLFAVLYWRRKKIHPDDLDARVDFIDDLGDKWQEFPIFHEGFKLWADINFPDLDLEKLTKDEVNDLIKVSPYHRSTAPEIDWLKRVEIQGLIQKYITHSISSTINLPETVSVDEVSQIYMEAWKQGLKGITVYRDGSRSGVLITKKEEKKEEFNTHHAPKRPIDLKCDIYTTTSKGTKYNVFVGLLNDNPFEVFATPYFTSGSEGAIRKMGKGKYDLDVATEPNGEIVRQKDFLSELSDEEAAITRLISTSLRHGADIKFVTEQLGKVEGTIVSFTKAIARILKKYVKEQDSNKKVKCENCGSTNVRFEEGCNKCLDCGSSKCG